MNNKISTDTTIDYYDHNAECFVNTTKNVNFEDTQNRFASLLPNAGYILDFGCGSGRDTLFFLNRGFHVDAIDGSAKLCDIAEKYTGIAVRQMLFQELDEVEKYDGIWACSSILHLNRKELQDVIPRMIRAVKIGGYIYTSFKYGDFEGFRGERYFTDYTEESFKIFISQFLEVEIIDEWISSDVRPGRGDEKWLNVILKKSVTV